MVKRADGRKTRRTIQFLEAPADLSGGGIKILLRVKKNYQNHKETRSIVFFNAE